MANLKVASNAFVDSLVDTGSTVSVTSFADNGSGPSGGHRADHAEPRAIKGSYATLTSNGRTNWQDGLLKAQSTFAGFHRTARRAVPTCVIVITDGNPNTINNGGGHLERHSRECRPP